MLKDNGRPELDYCKHGQQNRGAAVNDDLQMKGSIPLVPEREWNFFFACSWCLLSHRAWSGATICRFARKDVPVRRFPSRWGCGYVRDSSCNSCHVGGWYHDFRRRNE